MTIRVLVVDDQGLIRTGFVEILDRAPDIKVVGEAANGHEAIQAAETLLPDVVTMDIRMPKLDGIEATRRMLTRINAPPRILVVTMFNLDELVFDALTAGASGFLLKDASADELRDAVHIIASGQSFLLPASTHQLIQTFARQLPTKHNPELDSLTERERDTLRLLAAGRSNAEIAQLLDIAESTAKTHVSRVLT